MDKKYLYRIGYDTFEECEYEVLSHSSKLSKKELDEMVLEAIDSVIKDYIEREEYVGTYQFINNDIIGYLITNFGFESIEYENEWNVFGWTLVPYFDEVWADEYINDTAKLIDMLDKKQKEYEKLDRSSVQM